MCLPVPQHIGASEVGTINKFASKTIPTDRPVAGPLDIWRDACRLICWSNRPRNKTWNASFPKYIWFVLLIAGKKIYMYCCWALKTKVFLSLYSYIYIYIYIYVCQHERNSYDASHQPLGFISFLTGNLGVPFVERITLRKSHINIHWHYESNGLTRRWTSFWRQTTDNILQVEVFLGETIGIKCVCFNDIRSSFKIGLVG